MGTAVPATSANAGEDRFFPQTQMTDAAGNVIGSSAPATKAAAVTPNDSTDLATTARALYVGVSGDISLILAGDSSAVLFKAVPVGILPVSVKRVRATGTAATDLVALS